ncbi:MAG: hypothetical protein ABUK01_03645 [Leptospirales bacterium]
MSENRTNKRKAYVLISGGLDSTLAVKMLQDQGIEVTGVYISTGFCVSAQQKRNGRFDEAKPDVFKVSQELGIDLEVIDISNEYMSIVANPKYGWGKNVNPCIDCRIHMLQKTAELMKEKGGDFIATGEVLGQRPMSQRRDTIDLVAKKSGLGDLLLRPLSAHFFPETKPEKEGWVDRAKLGKLQGRSRKPQLAMAKKYNLQNIQTPAGGCCYLTDENYAVRFKDMLLGLKRMLKKPDSFQLEHNDMIIMSIGRQIKIRTGLKLACGRNESENNLLHHYRAGKLHIKTTDDNPGPSALLEIIPNENSINLTTEFDEWNYTDQVDVNISPFLEKIDATITPIELALCGAILGRYSDNKTGEDITIEVTEFDKQGTLVNSMNFTVTPLKNLSVLTEKLMIKENEKKILKSIA